jgi:KDO2-lipid IV(A) lauroyltransferase
MRDAIDAGRRPTVAHRIEFGAVAAAVGLSRLLPGGAMMRMAAAVGRLGYHLGVRRKVVEDNLRIAFADMDDAWRATIAKESYAHLARETIATLQAAPGGQPAAIAKSYLEGGGALSAALEGGRGAILLAGHLGNWELGVATVAGSGFPVDAIARRQNNPLFDRAILRARTGFGFHVIDRHNATRPSLESLRLNHVLVLVADQDARSNGVFVPFFKRLASTPRGPAVFALRTGAPVFLLEPLRQPDGRLRVRVIPLPFEPSGDPEADTHAITAGYAAALERSVRSAPGQYLWQHRRWKTKAPGG